jgi:TolA-binding protein
MKARRITDKLAISALLLIVSAAWLCAAPYVILSNGQRRDGVDIRVMSNGDVMLTLADGNQFTFTADQVERAVADKPPYFDQAVAALRAGRADIAVQGFEKVLAEYKGLDWDVRAMPLLAQAYIAKEDYAKAERAFENLFKANPRVKDNSELVISYAKVLLKAGKTAKLEQQLKQMIASGDQQAAGYAQLMRGNIEMENQNYKEAAKDFLRTVYFFRNQSDLMPEATFNLAESLDKLRDKRAKEWYATVAKNYPGTEYATKAQAKL